MHTHIFVFWMDARNLYMLIFQRYHQELSAECQKPRGAHFKLCYCRFPSLSLWLICKKLELRKRSQAEAENCTNIFYPRHYINSGWLYRLSLCLPFKREQWWIAIGLFGCVSFILANISLAPSWSKRGRPCCFVVDVYWPDAPLGQSGLSNHFFPPPPSSSSSHTTAYIF